MAYLTTLKLNSYFFIAIMFLIFAIFVTIIGVLINLPIIAMFVIFLFIILFQIMISSVVVKFTTRTRYLKRGEVPYLEKTVEELAREAGIKMPKLGIVEDPTPNAFVFGLTQGGSTLSVHTGLLEKLNDAEIRAVLGHEIGHIKNRDCMYMTILSTIPLIAYMGMRMLMYARFMPRGRGKGAGSAILVILLIGLISAVVYFLTTLLIKRISRIREFYADAYSGYLTKDPHSLASALTKITYGLSLAGNDVKTKSAARAFYIGDVQNAHKEIQRISQNRSRYDLDGDGVIDEHELELAMADESTRGAWDKFGGLFSTHPPTFKRILALKDMEKDMEKGVVTKENVYEKVEF